MYVIVDLTQLKLCNQILCQTPNAPETSSYCTVNVNVYSSCR